MTTKKDRKPKYSYRERTNALSVLVAGRIRTLRRLHNMAQWRLAELCGVSQGIANKWEKRHVPIDLEDLEKIAAALGVTPHALLDPDVTFTITSVVEVETTAGAAR